MNRQKNLSAPPSTQKKAVRAAAGSEIIGGSRRGAASRVYVITGPGFLIDVLTIAVSMPNNEGRKGGSGQRGGGNPCLHFGPRGDRLDLFWAL